MMKVDDCLRAGFAALMRGDYAGRDYYVRMAKTLLAMQERAQSPIAGDVICLPDRSKEG